MATNMSSYYGPKEAPELVAMERGLLDGYIIGGVSFGILLTLFVQSFHTLSWHQLRSGVTRVPLLCTIGGLFALASVGHWTRLKIVERSWVGDRSFPGGPLKFYDSMSTSALNIVGLASFLVMGWIFNFFMLQRLFIVSGRNKLTLVAPTLLYLGTICFSVLYIIKSSAWGSEQSSLQELDIELIYSALTVVLGVLYTALICTALIRQPSPGTKSEESAFDRVLSMFMESAALYSIPAFVFLIGLGIKSPAQYASESVMLLQGVCPLMIILWHNVHAPFLKSSSLSRQFKT